MCSMNLVIAICEVRYLPWSSAVPLGRIPASRGSPPVVADCELFTSPTSLPYSFNCPLPFFIMAALARASRIRKSPLSTR